MTGALDRALADLLARQQGRGCWEGEMVWSPVITAQWAIVQRLVGREPDAATRAGIVTHFRVTRTADRAWGLHPESGGYVFVTALVYVALRLLGVPPDDPLAADARRWLHAQPGGVPAIPTWGKLWLALLDLYGWDGVNPCPPELLLLPERVPFHPARYYCHTRYIYIAMAYLYGRRFRGDLGPLRDALRRELYAAPWEALDFRRHRHAIALGDLYVPPSPWLRRAADALTVHERAHVPALRRRALARCLDRILYEQRASNYHALSPVNGLLNCLALAAADPAHPELARSIDGMEAWRWQDEAEGVRYAGARSHAWDTAFAIQAVLAHPGGAAAAPALRRAYAFLRDTQIAEELAGGRAQGREPARGGWCFSDGAHRWPVSDCTAEALAAVLACHAVPGLIDGGARVPDARLAQAAEFILARQNADGGFGTYERRRGSLALERANPSEMFGQCMTERSYVECTASSLGALAHLGAARGDLAGPAHGAAIGRAVRFLRAAQRDDGAWPGFWGINFTYGIFHAVRGLRAAGVAPGDPALARAAAWLVAHQREDGGWGEHWRSCLDGGYVEHPESQVVMTSWALLALVDILGASSAAVKRGVAWLESRQRPDGSWPRQAVNGVFFGSAMLEYRLYASYFPAWALARATVS